jgi:hypothetical protein
LNCAFSIPRPQNFFCFSNPQSKVYLANFPAGRRRMPLWAGGRIPTSDFFYMLYALCCRLYTLFARNPKPETRNSQLATRNSNRLQRPARFCTAFINMRRHIPFFESIPQFHPQESADGITGYTRKWLSTRYYTISVMPGIFTWQTFNVPRSAIHST